MSDAKHTPGPWRVDEIDDEPSFFPGIEAGDPERGGTTIVMWGEEEDENAGVRGPTREVILANAKLIAAAPELADALFKFLATFPHSPDHDLSDVQRSVMAAARAALRKAGRLP